MNKHTYLMNLLTHTQLYDQSFKLHNHDQYEIYMFIEGDANYIVEGNTYTLEPYDMIIIRNHQMHRVFHKSNAKYSRFVINIHPDFFKEMNCTEYESHFTNDSLDLGNKISADVVRKSGIYDAFLRLKKYSDNFSTHYTPIVNSALVELLYLINNITSFSTADASEKTLEKVISYINNHYTEEISLNELSHHFYVSKYHLCRSFKKATGYTVHSYITHKRITRVRELIDEDMNISEAAAIAGFENYSSFYRAYLKEYGTTPKQALKKQA